MIRIAILLATFNGERYLGEQLASIESQTIDARLDVIASDDGSSDGTRDVLEAWRGRWKRGDFRVTAGPCRGIAENFRSLMTQSGSDADFIAFSDQDDVWMPDKLEVAIGAIGDDQGPTLFCSRTLLVDRNLRPIGRSLQFRRAPHFRNALVQSIAGGNTMVLNRPAFALVGESARRTSFVAHDWWCYILVSGAEGRVIYDCVPRVAYRQHQANAIGHNTGLRARLVRLKRALQGQFRDWNSANVAALDKCRDLLSPKSMQVLDQFIEARRSGAGRSLYLIVKSGIYRQLPGGNLSLALAAILRKL
jgi:glycosyltransferase involved in cell wall biosynthesis